MLATLFEESTARADQLKAGALGFKAGVFLPIYVEIPLALKLSGGIARSVLHPSPILGKKEKTVSKNNMFLLDAGLLYQHQNFLISLTYQYNTIDYFTRKTFVTFGVNY